MRTIKIAVVTAAALVGILAPAAATVAAAVSDSGTHGVVLADGTGTGTGTGTTDDTPWG